MSDLNKLQVVDDDFMSNEASSFFAATTDNGLMPRNREKVDPVKVSLTLNKSTVDRLNIPEIKGETRDLTGPGGIAFRSTDFLCGKKECRHDLPDDPLSLNPDPKAPCRYRESYEIQDCKGRRMYDGFMDETGIAIIRQPSAKCTE